MTKRMQKAPALLLAFLLLAANLTAELAHHHFAPPPVKNSNGQIETAVPQIIGGPQRCCACLFAHENQAAHTGFSGLAAPSPFVFIKPSSPPLFTSVIQSVCRNRAPPTWNQLS
jgi:hypothetical protein